MVHLAGVRHLKRMPLSVRALGYARQRVPKLHLWLAGPVLEQSAWRELSRALGEQPGARYVGELDRDEALGLLNEATIALNTSDHEGMSAALMEAMTLGRPIIASSCPGNRMLIRDDHDGLLFPPGDVDALGRAMVRLAKNSDLRNRLGSSARLRARRFSPEKEAEAYHELYQELLQG